MVTTALLAQRIAQQEPADGFAGHRGLRPVQFSFGPGSDRRAVRRHEIHFQRASPVLSRIALSGFAGLVAAVSGPARELCGTIFVPIALAFSIELASVLCGCTGLRAG